MAVYSELRTIRDFIRFATSEYNKAGLFYGHGTDNAWDEAASLVLHTLHLPHDINPAVLDAALIQEEKSELSHLIEKRVLKRIPTPYLTHEAWFANLPFYVDERVLIPRSPIAELISNQFEPWVNPLAVNRILDLCTGSGCIGIACAKAFPEAEVDISDISEDALAVAKINILRHKVDDQVKIIQSDLFKSISDEKYDIIVSNPPYVSLEEMAELPEEYHHEPKLGLEAGVEGLDLVEHILRQAKNHLSPEGILVVEVGNSEYALMDKYPHIPFTWIEFQHSDGGVFLLTADQVKEITI